MVYIVTVDGEVFPGNDDPLFPKETDWCFCSAISARDEAVHVM